MHDLHQVGCAWLANFSFLSLSLSERNWTPALETNEIFSEPSLFVSAIVTITLQVMKLALVCVCEWVSGLLSRPGHRGHGDVVCFLSADSTHSIHRMTDKPDGRANGNGRVSSASSSHNEHALALALLSVSRTKCTRSAQVYIHFGGRHPTNLPPAVPQYALHPGLLHLVEIQFSHRKANVTDGGFDLALTVTVMSCEPDPSGFYSLFFTVSDGKVTVKSGDRLSGMSDDIDPCVRGWLGRSYLKRLKVFVTTKQARHLIRPIDCLPTETGW